MSMGTLFLCIDFVLNSFELSVCFAKFMYITCSINFVHFYISLTFLHFYEINFVYTFSIWGNFWVHGLNFKDFIKFIFN